eukprot:sb/3462458/
MTVSGGLRSWFKRAPSLSPRIPLPEITSFTQHCTYGPGSRDPKVYSWKTLKQVYKDEAHVVDKGPHTGLFGYPLLSTPDGFYRAWFLCKQHCDELVQQIVSQEEPSVDILKLFDDLSNAICVYADCINFIVGNPPDKKIGDAAWNCAITAAGYVEELNTNQDLYKAIREVSLDRNLLESMGEEDRLALFSLVREMEISGIHLPVSLREKYVSLTAQLHKDGAVFTDLAHKPVKLSFDILPPALRGSKRGDYDKRYGHSEYLLNNSGSDHNMADIREFTWMKYHAHCPERETALLQLLNTRHSMANTVGFDSFAQREILPTMAGSPETVSHFLELLKSELEPFVQQEVEHIKHAKAEDCRHHTGDMELNPWCGRYYPGMLNSQYNIANHDHNMFLDQLDLGNVVNALNLFCEDVLHVSLVVEEASQGELVHKDLVKIAVFDERDGLVGYLYLDLCDREGKDPRTCLHTVTCGTHTQVPVVVLQCGMPGRGEPGKFEYQTLSISQVQTLFHELGHALHGILGRTKYQHTSGTRGPTDFAEIPSTLFENFISHPRVWYNCINPRTPFKDSHFKFGTEHLFNTPYTALEMETNILHAMLDQRLHSSGNLTNTLDITQELQSRYSSLSYPEGTSWHLRFSHLQFYGARYYSYLWSRSIANLIFYNLFYDDPFSESGGERLKEFLRRGSSVNYKRSVEELVGYEFGVEEMVGALVEPVKMFSRGYLDHQEGIGEKWW